MHDNNKVTYHPNQPRDRKKCNLAAYNPRIVHAVNKRRIRIANTPSVSKYKMF
jgi:hypothetical protein